MKLRVEDLVFNAVDSLVSDWSSIPVEADGVLSVEQGAFSVGVERYLDSISYIHSVTTCIRALEPTWCGLFSVWSLQD